MKDTDEQLLEKLKIEAKPKINLDYVLEKGIDILENRNGKMWGDRKLNNLFRISNIEQKAVPE